MIPKNVFLPLFLAASILLASGFLPPLEGVRGRKSVARGVRAAVRARDLPPVWAERADLPADGGGVWREHRLFGEAALKWPFSNANRVDFPVIGKVKVRPEGELGWSAEAGIKTGWLV